MSHFGELRYLLLGESHGCCLRRRRCCLSVTERYQAFVVGLARRMAVSERPATQSVGALLVTLQFQLSISSCFVLSMHQVAQPRLVIGTFSNRYGVFAGDLYLLASNTACLGSSSDPHCSHCRMSFTRSGVSIGKSCCFVLGSRSS